MTANNLDSLFKPSSIALIGASTKELSIGNVIIKNLQHYGYKGPIYPIHPKADEVRGIKAYPTILDTPGPVELAHIVIPPPFVPEQVELCGKKGVKAIIINTAGFKEMGAGGQALEDDFLNRARKYGIRIFGPNCQGTINSDPGLRAYCDFTFTYPKPGHISVVAQSGGVGAVIMQAIDDMDIGMRFYASNGNASDVSIPEIIRYYGNDPETRVIVLYVESLANPAEFMQIAREVTAKKPILALTAGTTDKGAEASRSHIGGLAGSISMEVVFKKTGILYFDNQQDMVNAAEAFAYQPIPKGNKVGIITNTGGPSVIAIDELVRNGLEILPLSDKAKTALQETMFESASIANPLDVVATAGAPQFRSAFEVMMAEEQVDSVYVNFVTPPFVDCEAVAKEFAWASSKYDKPIVCNYMTDKKSWQGTTKILKDGSIPCFDFAETSAKALASLVRYQKIRSVPSGEIPELENIDRNGAKEIIASARAENKPMLNAEEVYRLLEAYGIPVAGWAVATTVDEGISASQKLGFPLVLKADSEEIIHKSDVGGVILNIGNEEELKSGMEKMKSSFKVSDLKFFIQQQKASGTELIIGAKKEEGLGHLIMFGLGGVFVEVFKDVTFNIAPLTDVEATAMPDEIQASVLLGEFRGKQAIDKVRIADILLRLSQMVSDHPQIKELDINPVLASAKEVCAVDARVLF